MLEKFKEINQRAATKIGEAIKKLSDQDVRVDIPTMERKDVHKIRSFFESEEKVAVVYIPVTGALEGCSVFVFSRESAFAMADYLQKRILGTTHALSQLDISALKELGNITVCTYLSVVAKESKIESKSHGGRFSCDVFNAIAEEIIADLAKGQKEFYVMEIIFSIEAHSYKGDILFLFEEEKLKELLGGGSEKIYI